jgi:hypothetical protein
LELNNLLKNLPRLLPKDEGSPIALILLVPRPVYILFVRSGVGIKFE